MLNLQYKREQNHTVMAAKKAAPTDDELNKLLEGIGDESAPASAPSKSTTTKKAAPVPSQEEQDLLAELDNLEKLGADKPARPNTPRVTAAAAGARPSPIKRTTTGTPPPPVSGRSSEDKPPAPRKSAESARSFHTSFTPSATSSELQESEKNASIAEASEAPAAAGGGWWGSVFSTATAAMKQAEAAVSQIQQNEDAKKYLEQVKGNVVTLRGFGMFLSFPISNLNLQS